MFNRTLMCIVLIGFIALLALHPAYAQKPSNLAPMEQLGKDLFFDKISEPGWMSCSSCHSPNVGWDGAVSGINRHGAVYRGAVPQRFGNRKPPTSAYPFSPVFHLDETSWSFVGGTFWDGRATGERLGTPAADQALGPFLNPVEQNMPTIVAVCEEVERSKYADSFEEVWGPGSLDCSMAGAEATYDKIGLSIAAYEASSEVSPFDSKFDAYWEDCTGAGNSMEDCGLAGGSKAVLDPNNVFSDLEWDGLIEFGEYCSPCHISHELGPNGEPPLFTDFTFDNIGVPKNSKNPFYKMDKIKIDDTPINPEGENFVDYGLGDFLRTRPEWDHMADENDGKMKVPTLRNVGFSQGGGQPQAYMHNGVFKSLAEVVHFYNTRDVPEENWPPPEVPQNVNHEILAGAPLGNFGLSAEDEAAIVAFMETLSDGYVRHDAAPAVASLNARAVDSKGTILFAMPSAGSVEVKVYDVAGRQVRRMGIQSMPAGINRIHWDGRDDNGRTARSGIYFYQIRTQEQMETGKAILIR